MKVWSFGMVLFEMMSLERPDASLSAQYKVSAGNFHVVDDLKRNPLPKTIQEDDFFQGLVAVYEDCTQIEPSKRPNAESVVKKLETVSLVPEYFIKRSLLDIGELIGKGKNSKVYKGTCRCNRGNNSKPHPVAIKTFPLSDALNSSDMLQRLSTLYKLDSAHVLTPHGYNWQDRSQFVVVLPLMDKLTNLQTLITKRYSIYQSLLHIAKGVSYLHNKKLFIGNLNSKNIWVRSLLSTLCSSL
jgi:serine/threonine protein kinase